MSDMGQLSPEPRVQTDVPRRTDGTAPRQAAGGSVLTPACASSPSLTHARPLPNRHVLGPIVRWARLESPLFGRVYALGIVLAAGAVMLAAWRIHPQHQLMGTHQQLGLPP